MIDSIVTEHICGETMQKVYRSNLKNREFFKETGQILGSGKSEIVREQGASEDPKFLAKPTQSKPDSLSCFRIWLLLAVSTFFLSGCSTKGDSDTMAAANADNLQAHSKKSTLVGGVIGAVSEGIASSTLDSQARMLMEEKSPNTLKKIDRGQRLSLNDIKAMSEAGISDPVITSQICTTGSIFYLTTSDIMDLKSAGVSERVIDVMIQTGG